MCRTNYFLQKNKKKSILEKKYTTYNKVVQDNCTLTINN